MDKTRFEKAIQKFDAYNSNDPNSTTVNGKDIPEIGRASCRERV